MLRYLFLAAVTLLPLVQASSWDDFSNNLATDLAPFVSLFGEQLTKQYLSESTTKLDYFIFAMAPLGIITALISAIRVCGSPALRAFVGRAQEGRGIAEAELCSSTSRDVCELYNNGGIARVFGRPKILEVVFDRKSANSNDDGAAGLYTFAEYYQGKGQDMWKHLQKKTKDGQAGLDLGGKMDEELVPEKQTVQPAFSPNLSLNIGIKRQPDSFFWFVAISGFVLQIGVLVFAGIVTYKLKLEVNDKPPESYACPLVLIGTVLVTLGIYLCAFLIGESTHEEVWQRKNKDEKLSICWVQPGGQIVGDQTFDAFGLIDDGVERYTTSSKGQSINSEFLVWITIFLTLSGFILQFTGLRAVHASVSVAQLGVMMLMSVARAALRMKRLGPEANTFSEFPDEILGHELDWLALRIGQEDAEASFKSVTDNKHLSHCLWRFSGVPAPNERLQQARLQGCTTKDAAPSDTVSKTNSLSLDPNAASKLLAYRTRLAHLTSSSPAPSRSFGDEMVGVRAMAQRLAEAIESSVKAIFHDQELIKKEWRKATSLQWGISCNLSVVGSSNNEKSNKSHTAYLELNRTIEEGRPGPWKLLNKLQLEGILGLWIWSLKSDRTFETRDSQTNLITSLASKYPTQRIIAPNQATAEDLRMWCGEEVGATTEQALVIPFLRLQDASTIWAKNRNEDFFGPLSSNPPTQKGIVENLSPASRMRLFGWHAIDLRQELIGTKLNVWMVPTRSSLLFLCAQEVFGSFLKCAMGSLDAIGDVSIQEEVKRTKDFRLENRMVTELVQSFIHGQLGPRDEALQCVMPSILSIISQLKMPAVHTALASAKQAADQYRRRRDWDNAEAVLKWCLRVCDQSAASHSNPSGGVPCSSFVGEYIPLQEAYAALGELYRWQIADGERKQFGLNGVSNLDTILTSGKRHSPEVMEIIKRYQYIATKCNSPGGVQPRDGSLEEHGGDLTARLLQLTHPTAMTAVDKSAGLLEAAMKGWGELVSVLLELGTEPDSKDSTSRTALSHAAGIGRLDIVQTLLKSGAYPNSQDAKNRTPLSYASEEGRTGVVATLLKDPRVLPDHQDSRTWVPLSHALSKGHTELVKLFSEHPSFNPNITVCESWTPLSWAAEKGDITLVDLLTTHPNTRPSLPDPRGFTPLQCAANYGHLSVVKRLLETEGVEPEEVGTRRRTPLILAAAGGHISVVNELLATGKVDPSKDDSSGDTALSYAAEGGHTMVVEKLIATGRVDVNAGTPLRKAALKGHLAIVQMILATGQVAPDKRPNNQMTPLAAAARNGYRDIVKVLLETGQVDPDADSTDGTPLALAAAYGHLSIVKDLLATGRVNPEASCRSGTPLSRAAYQGELEVVKELLSTGKVDPNGRGMAGMTPLAGAAYMGQLEVVKELLATGNVDPRVKDEDGKTAYALVMERRLEDYQWLDEDKLDEIAQILRNAA